MMRVLKPGFYTSIQDLGRLGYRNIGIPISGVMDAFSAGLANEILTNKPEDALLEIALGGVDLLIEKQIVITITGVDFKATLNQALVPQYTPICMVAGDRLKFNFSTKGGYGYLAVKGGIQSPIILGSRSCFKGITDAGLIVKNQQISCLIVDDYDDGFEVQNGSSIDFDSQEIEVYKGPEYDLCLKSQQELLLQIPIPLSNDCNRMGYRLESPLKTGIPSILTSTVLPGTVQCTPSGELIVLMRDAQVTGGYARIFQVTDMAINRLAQKRPGEKVVFRLID